jgi:ADP-ribosylglycohydrolase
MAKRAVAFGNDTDTTACVAGGVAGLRWGAEAIPARWMEALREKVTVEQVLAGLLSSIAVNEFR